MNNYKIKISCTSVKKLCYNNKKITNKLNLEKLINNNDYIKKALILYKKINGCPFTTKTLEFICDNKLSKMDFEIFIKEMKMNGFNSNNNTKIYFINTTNNETLYNYDFSSVCKVDIIKSKGKPNNSTYHIQILYKKPLNKVFQN